MRRDARGEFPGRGNKSPGKLVTRPSFSTNVGAFFTIGLAIALATSVFAQTDIYILAGQSNMTGVAPLAGEPTPQNQSRLMAYTWKGSWEQAKDPLSGYAGAGVGPGLWFADRMATLCPGVTIGVVMCARGGSFLSEWMPDYSTHSLYGNMLAQARKASAYGRIRGLLWYQGESECGNRNNVILYGPRMHTIFSAIRQDLGISDLPIIFVQLGPNPHEPGFEFWHDVQVKQQSIADAEAPFLDMVTAEDLHAISPANPHHLDQPSQIILGGRMADAMYQIMP